MIVVNGYKSGWSTPDTIYIGRESRKLGLLASPLANPYPLTNEAHREIVISQYRRWLWESVKKQDARVTNELRRIIELDAQSEVALACYCKPKVCHGDVIVAACEYLKGKSYET